MASTFASLATIEPILAILPTANSAETIRHGECTQHVLSEIIRKGIAYSGGCAL
jgi:hypothetical protein